MSVVMYSFKLFSMIYNFSPLVDVIIQATISHLYIAHVVRWICPSIVILLRATDMVCDLLLLYVTVIIFGRLVIKQNSYDITEIFWHCRSSMHP